MTFCARIDGSIHMTTHTLVLIETLKDFSSDLCWCSSKMFYTQDHTVAVITHDESSAVIYWKGESI